MTPRPSHFWFLRILWSDAFTPSSQLCSGNIEFMKPSIWFIMEISTAGQKTICLPFASEKEYRKVIANCSGQQ